MTTSSTQSQESNDDAILRHLRSVLEQRSKEKRLSRYKPYPKQHVFHKAGRDHRERLLMAANQVGKTLSASAEVAMHLTGRYPADWEGRRWDRPVIGWAAGITGESTRDNPQRLLVGRPGEHGTGMIPRELLMETRPAPHGVADSLDHIKVRHEPSGGVSILYFKSYEKGRAKWQGETLDFVWFDEEPPEDIYTEGLTRTNATKGMTMITFTPLLGMSNVVKRFVLEKPPGTHVTSMTIDDAGHYTPEERAAIVSAYPAHEREARAKGIPSLGSGRVFPVTDAEIEEPSIQLPDHWVHICGTDFGWGHPFGAVWIAWDRDADVAHVYDCYRVKEKTPAEHALVLNAKPKWIPVAWPHDGLAHDKGSGKTLAQQYRDAHVNMLGFHATHAGGDGKGYGFEAGISAMLQRMQSGRLKVAKHLTQWWEEFHLYHRKDGLVVKEGDDLMSATRIGLMMLRYAKEKPRVVVPTRPPLFGASPTGWMG